jgi:outer membrane protein assembly factor BamB
VAMNLVVHRFNMSSAFGTIGLTVGALSLLLLVGALSGCSRGMRGEPVPREHARSVETASSAEHDATPVFTPVAGLPEGFRYDVEGSPDAPDAEHGFEGFGISYANDTLSIFCFRGGHRRDRASLGHVTGRPVDVVLDWRFNTAASAGGEEADRWGGGAGWTGQPLLIRWNREQKLRLGIRDRAFVDSDEAMELIIGSLSGSVYFLDAATGAPTREHLHLGNPIKGTVSVDPRKNGLLYVGQGIPYTDRFGARVFDMFTRQELLHIAGNDAFSHRRWGAFDGNAIVDERSGTVFWAAESGLVHRFTIGEDLKVRGAMRMRYARPGMAKQGIESSMAVIADKGFVADNSGTVLCVDLRTMTPVWSVDNGDDTDATIVVDEESPGQYSLYTASEVDLTGPVGEAHLRKLDAATGREIWRVSRTCRSEPLGGRTNSGGVLATPLIVRHGGRTIVYAIFSRTDEFARGEFVAIDARTGHELFSIQMNRYSWSSPAGFRDEDGNPYVFFSDVSGIVYVVDALTGEVLVRKRTGHLFESSPIVFHDRAYIASRGRAILGFRIITSATDPVAVAPAAARRTASSRDTRISAETRHKGNPQGG